MKSVLMLLALSLIGLGLFGLIRPGNQWWRASRQRSALLIVIGVFIVPVSTFFVGFGQGLNDGGHRVTDALDRLSAEVTEPQSLPPIPDKAAIVEELRCKGECDDPLKDELPPIPGTEAVSTRNTEAILSADLSGVWIVENPSDPDYAYVWMYPDHRYIIRASGCTITSQGTWKYSGITLEFTTQDGEKSSLTVSQVPRTWSYNDLLVFNVHKIIWKFTGRDTELPC